ncbi:MAG: CARDB domain-containing protein [Candidatus Micrarchaeia archaeon]|jgi:hypothetical protein
MDKIDYLIAAFFVAVVLVALYIRFSYQPPVNIAVAISNYNATVFPFEKVSIPISVKNLGSSDIKGMGFEVLVNGNMSRLYSLTIPSGKEATLYFNFTPDSYGSFNITAIADPAKLYSIVDRSKTSSSIMLKVAPPEALRAYAPINPNGIVQLKEANLTATGALAALYLYSNYSLQGFRLFDLNLPYTLFSSLIGLTYNYINQIGVAYANYTNGSSIYSMWLRGYINKGAIESALSAVNANYTTIPKNGENVIFAKISNNTTLCSWYANGWIKNIVFKSSSGNGSCLDLVGLNYSNPLPASLPTNLENFSPSNTVALGDIESYYFPTNSPSVAKIISYSNAFVIPYISTNLGSIICYGIVSNVTNQSYCSTYLFQTSHKIGALGLVRTTTYIPPYNFSVFSLVNQSAILATVPINIGLIQELGAKGSSLSFISGFTNTCRLANFSCINPKFSNGQLILTLKNVMNSSVRISGISCYVGSGKVTPANVTLNPNAEASLAATCYENGNVISGIPFGLRVALNVSYSINNQSKTSLGSAVINFFGQ